MSILPSEQPAVALRRGRLCASSSVALLDLPTNPVQVLDLALFLPARLTSAVLLLRRRPLGYATVPVSCSSWS